ncbi:type II toxin-antitoxin system Phd/YefM family antitoxin [Methylophaga sp.]|uniref:type II toxin-antitoxin system Phd/YefM family antitoxin n=1 Tax=Methylophaga sp. TaxID=2024840 RepID=UPI00271BF04D|nr:type II toxin-antitoxin system Phd/YefM family antitoxin [Methylophaga sp.]MDO8826366.1 type II toxin-antitoxin system Phd/YefM family antitoxin [Methylophaga sp.]
MKSVSLKQFRNNFEAFVDKVLTGPKPLKVKSQSGKEIILISFTEWKREQETLYVLQNNNLMRQIAESKITHGQ